jgi:hypothetical protein
MLLTKEVSCTPLTLEALTDFFLEYILPNDEAEQEWLGGKSTTLF